jgi:hypothetical protein
MTDPVTGEAMAQDPLDRTRRLAGNFAEWAKIASLREMIVILDALQDELILRGKAAAALVAGASEVLRRELGGGA